jgi:hypothetical protein
MAYTLEISYFNSVILKPDTTVAQVPANNLDGTPFTITDATAQSGDWHVEESRIKGAFNEDSMGFGVKAFITDENYKLNHRFNAMIYSGIFNTKTNVNQTNEFSTAEAITRAVDAADGSIQKLYAEDTNLLIFQEDKVSRALIDKDAIFTAEGQNLTVSGAKVIGQIVPYSGRFGISKNPESFAVYGNRKYFSDKNRRSIIRLSQDGITPISMFGMSDYFKDKLSIVDNVFGVFDENHKKYVICLKDYSNTENNATVSFDDGNNGWISFYTYTPNFAFSLNSKYYTFNNIDLYEHYANEARNTFYDQAYVSTVDLIANQTPSIVKNFHTINYEGSSGWKMNSSVTDSSDSAFAVLSDDTATVASTIPVNFVRKEDKYYGHLRNNTSTNMTGQVVGIDVSGIKGFFTKVQLENNKTTAVELFSVSHEAVFSSN